MTDTRTLDEKQAWQVKFPAQYARWSRKVEKHSEKGCDAPCATCARLITESRELSLKASPIK